MIPGLDWAATAAFALVLTLVLARTAVGELSTAGPAVLRRFDVAAGAAVVALVVVLVFRVLAQL
ncbi:hypothetical protein [Amycolatopsis sp. NPDC051903]|uniref:hypothetical protein n=1 Tax=Amycolatopsis sp. NPDC051903 TaxID=3363936 RepID=UPI00378A1E33